MDIGKTDREYKKIEHIPMKHGYSSLMAKKADICILFDPDVYNEHVSTQSPEKNKYRLFTGSELFSTEPSYKYLDCRYGFTPNYIADQRLFELAVFLYYAQAESSCPCHWRLPQTGNFESGTEEVARSQYINGCERKLRVQNV